MQPIVIGGGVAGLACAAAIRQTPLNAPTLIERRPAGTHAGLGFLLMPNGIEALQQLAPDVDWRATGQTVNRIQLRLIDGVLLDEKRLEPTVCVSRQTFIQALLGAANITPRFDSGLDHFITDNRGWVGGAVLEDGTSIKGDVFFACDGVGSRARELTFPHARLGAVVVKEIVSSIYSPALAEQLGATFHKFHDMSGGLAIGVIAESDTRVVWFLQYEASRYPGVTPTTASLSGFAKEVTRGGASLIQEVVQATDFDQSYLWSTRDLLPLDELMRENLVLIGDAAHACLPFTSQGANGALVDAALLAKLLANASRKEDLPVAFQAYSTQRRARNHLIFAEGRRLRDAFLEPLGDLAPGIPLVD